MRYNFHMNDDSLSHLDAEGRAHMVNVGHKPVTSRWAVAKGEIRMRPETLNLLREGALEKGDVLTVAKIAGINAAKKTADLIPLCHPLALNQVTLSFDFREELPGVEITAEVHTDAKTGVEMEALTAVSVAALTIYDMAKAVEKTMVIGNIRLVEKHGGQSGDVINE